MFWPKCSHSSCGKMLCTCPGTGTAPNNHAEGSATAEKHKGRDPTEMLLTHRLAPASLESWCQGKPKGAAKAKAGKVRFWIPRWSCGAYQAPQPVLELEGSVQAGPAELQPLCISLPCSHNDTQNLPPLESSRYSGPAWV